MRLPYRLAASEGLNVENCPNLETIGLDGYAGSYFTITGCEKISSIQADMIVDGELGVSECGEFESLHPGMNQATEFSTEHFSLMENSVAFFSPVPMTVLASCMGNTLRSVFAIPMIDSFPHRRLLRRNLRMHVRRSFRLGLPAPPSYLE